MQIVANAKKVYELPYFVLGVAIFEHVGGSQRLSGREKNRTLTTKQPWLDEVMDG